MQSESFNQDTYCISTILEDMFQYLDDGVVDKKRQYQRLETGRRLRAALIVFINEGLARLDETHSPSPMWVPTKELLDVLGTSRLTTPVDPLVLPAVINDTRREAKEYYSYAKDLTLALEELPGYVAQLRPALGVSELGWAEHIRADDGRLSWSITNLGIENIENGNVARLALSDEPIGRN